MTKITRRNLARAGIAQAGTLGLAGALAAPALAQSGKIRWRMVTSWPKRLPGPGMSAERVPIRSATRSADVPGPGSRLGHEVTMRQRILPLCANAGADSAPASPSAPACAMPARVRLRRVILVISNAFRSSMGLTCIL